MNATKKRRSLPVGWSDADWAAARRAIRTVIWSYGLLNEPVGYKELTEEADCGISCRSPWLTPILNEIAAHERQSQRAHEKCWVTAFAVWSGTKRSSEGLFRLVPKSEWESMGKTAFCVQQRRLAHIWIAEHPET